MARIAFVGLGQMGGPMSRNLLKAGHELRVFDLDPQAVAAVAAAGATLAASAREAAIGAEFAFTILPVGQIVEEAVLGPEGLAHGLGEGALLVDMSTILPEETRRIGQRLGEQGVPWSMRRLAAPRRTP